MVKNNLTNFVKCGVRHNFLCYVILPLWVLLLLAGLESQVQVVLLCVSSDTSAFEFCHPLISCLL